MSPPLTKSQRDAKQRKERRNSRGPLEITNDHDRRSEMRRSQLSQRIVQPSSTVGSSSSSSSAIHNENNRINDSDKESAFSEDGLQPSPTQSPVKKRQNIPRCLCGLSDINIFDGLQFLGLLSVCIIGCYVNG
jgi:hypothetical protein